MANKIFHLQPWAPEAILVAQKLVSDIHTVAPELEVLFMGALALGLPGKNDIDLDILCDHKDIASYTEKLRTVLGEPKEAKETLAVWEYELGGYEIDCILSDPSTSHVPLQKKRFEILQSSPSLREEYKKLKEACDGLPYAEYEKRKISFLEERVFSSNDNAV